jgi:preprotein translocase subunit SecB
MTVLRQENLKFKGVSFISLNYNCTKPYDNEEIVLNVTPSIFLHKESKDSFEIIMSVNVSAEGSFIIETNAIGAFTIGEDASDEYRKIFMNVNSPAIMFPYVRAFLSTITASFGTNATGTITIPAQTFTGELDIINPDDTEVTVPI